MRHSDWKSYQDHADRRLHVYGPDQWHGETFVVGNRAALKALREALDEALETGSGLSLAYAADGEGFACGVVLVEDEGVWEEVALPYHGDLARDKRELHEVLTPTLGGHGKEPTVELARWRRFYPDRVVWISGSGDRGALEALVKERSYYDDGVARLAALDAGERASVMAASPEAAAELAVAVEALGFAAEHRASTHPS